MSLATLAPVSCPNCGVGLKVLGGGRVVTQICSHCGTQLDTIANYRALAKFANRERPDTPFQIGMTARLLDVDWTLIGILGLREDYHGRVWNWVDHLLYSPTHGYAWLTLEDAHLTLTRRYRGAVTPGWLSLTAIEAADNPPVLHTPEADYKYYETSTAKVSYAEGEFTWRVGLGDTTTTVSAMSRDAMLDLSQNGAEREVERTVYLDQPTTWAAFGLPPLKPYKVHPLQPAKAGPNADFLMRLGAIGTGICLLLTLIFAGMSGTTALDTTRIDRAALPAELPLTIDSLRGLTTLTIQTDVQNSWAWVEATLVDPEGAPVFTAGREISYYNGTDADGYWSEGNTVTRISFHPQITGEYALELDVPEGGFEEDVGPPQISYVTVQASTGASSPFWTLLAMIGFALMAASPFARTMLHNRARWRGTDWSDSD